MKLRLFIIYFIFFVGNNAYSQNCRITNTAFKAGEKLKYIVSYDLYLVWTDVGEVVFEVKNAKAGNLDLYHLYGTGRTYPNWDTFFKVRDVYQTWVEPANLTPLLFKRDVSEGGYEIDIKFRYNWKDSVMHTSSKKTNKPLAFDTIPINPCVRDVMSVVYYARNIDYSKCKENDSIPLSIILDSEYEPISFFYRGKEEIKLRKLGSFNCLKFEASLVEGSIFKKGDFMKIWITDDLNHIPLLVESPILVGSVKVRLVEMTGIRNVIKSKID